jgi:hypothetical protein
MKHCFYALLLVSLSACSADRSETGQVADPNPTIIVTYQVPPATENQIESVINSLLGVGEDGERIGRARVLPNRMVVVSAPAAVHPGIDAIIKNLWDTPIGDTQRIRLHYWLVRGEPDVGVVIPHTLADIEAALNDAATTAGPMRFEKLDYVQHSLRSGANAAVSGGILHGRVEAATVADRVSLNLSLQAPAIRSELRTEMDLASGETVVLAQMGSQVDQETGSSNAVHLFVIRAEAF